jgi:hypothetical protein
MFEEGKVVFAAGAPSDIWVRHAMFDLVTDNGTLEHLFSQASAFQWMHDLCKTGGLMLHVLPWHGWINHGFYNYHPVVFRDLAVANSYVVEALYAGERGGRLDRLDGPIEPYRHPKPAKEPITQIEQVLKSYGDRSNVFICALLRKTTDEPFKFPTQGKYEPEMKAFAKTEVRRPTLLDGPLEVLLDPFPHVIVENALPQDLYDQLAKSYPDWKIDETDPIGNTLHQLSAHKFIYSNDTAKVWKQFAIDHCHLNFFLRLNEIFGEFVKPMMAKLQDGELKVGMRNTGEFDINMDVQLGVNTPAKERSRVRGPHVDSPDELMAGLLYMPHPEDKAGGDLILYRWITEDAHLIGKAEIRDGLVEEAGRVRYKPNTAIFFVNGKDTIHGVDYRAPGKFPRRYINFAVTANKPVLDFYPRRKTDDWAGVRRVHQR